MPSPDSWWCPGPVWPFSAPALPTSITTTGFFALPVLWQTVTFWAGAPNAPGRRDGSNSERCQQNLSHASSPLPPVCVSHVVAAHGGEVHPSME